MSITVRFYPVGNGNSAQIILENGKRLLFDFRQVAQGEEEEHAVIDLAAQIRRELDDADRDDFDVVAFTHGDDDHIAGAPDFFHLDYAKEYQGGNRKKIKELWVPAAFILDDDPNESHRPLRQEARYRLKRGSGIRVFSKPEKLHAWMREQGIDPATRDHLITDAGKVVPGFTKQADGVEFFAHSPFIKHVDGGEDILRNECALILHATFLVGGQETRAFLIGDTDSDVLTDIVNTTRAHGNHERLLWDLYSIPHHCSHHALNPDRGKTITTPVEKVQYLLDQGQQGAYLVSSSLPIGSDYERKMPPHVQAYNAYKKVADDKVGSIYLTADSEDKYGDPAPLDIEITARGCLRKLGAVATAAISMSSRPAPRAGKPRGV